MQCPCGGETAPHSHELKTRAGIAKWLQEVSEFFVPHNIKAAVVQQDKCSECGRLAMEMHDQDGNLIAKRG